MQLSELIAILQSMDTAEADVLVEAVPGEYEIIVDVERSESGDVVIVTG